MAVSAALMAVLLMGNLPWVHGAVLPFMSVEIDPSHGENGLRPAQPMHVGNRLSFGVEDVPDVAAVGPLEVTADCIAEISYRCAIGQGYIPADGEFVAIHHSVLL